MLAQWSLLVLFAVAMFAATAWWFVRAGHWKRPRLALFTIGIFGGLLLLTRRVGWGELVVLAVLILLPYMLVGPNPNKKRPPPAARRTLPADSRRVLPADRE